jgi:YesN/AraC family two-component response regulator
MPIKVLLVDDEEDILWGLSEELTRHKIEVETASNGLEALEKIKKKSFDFLVTDIRMPGLSGVELLMETRKIQPDIKVIVMTAYGSDEIRQDVMTKGAISYLEKPFDFDQILNVILEKEKGGEEETLKNLTLQQFLQLVAMEGKSCEVIVNTSEGEGKIFFEDGEVINASLGNLRGEEAFTRIMKEPESSFKVKWGSPKVKREIEKPFHALLLSAAVQKDEEVVAREEISGLDLQALSELFKDEGVTEGEPVEKVEIPEVEESFEVKLEEVPEETEKKVTEEAPVEEKEEGTVTLEEVESILEGLSAEEAPKKEEAREEEAVEIPIVEEKVVEKKVETPAPTPEVSAVSSKLSQELKDKFSSVVKEISDILALVAVDGEGNILNISERVTTGVSQVLKTWAPAFRNIIQIASKTPVGAIKDITLSSDKYHLLITEAKNGNLIVVAVIPVKSMKIALVKIKVKELIAEIAKAI